MKPSIDNRLALIYALILGVGGHAGWTSWQRSVVSKNEVTTQINFLVDSKKKSDDGHATAIAKLETDLDHERELRKSAERYSQDKDAEIKRIQEEKSARDAELSDINQATAPSSNGSSALVDEAVADTSSGIRIFSPGEFKLDSFGFVVRDPQQKSGGKTWHRFDGPGTTHLIVEVEPNDSEDACERMRRVQRQMVQRSTTYKLVRMNTESVVDGNPAGIWEFEDTQDKRYIHKLICYMKSGGTGYRVIAWSDSAEWDSRKPLLLKLMETFSVGSGGLSTG